LSAPDDTAALVAEAREIANERRADLSEHDELAPFLDRLAAALRPRRRETRCCGRRWNGTRRTQRQWASAPAPRLETPAMTDEEHTAALERIYSLMGSQAGTPEAAELEALAIAVEAYETKRFPIDPPTPAEAAAFRAEQIAAPVVTLYESNFRDPAATLRHIADNIEAGVYGEIGSLGVVLLGDTCEVFGAGPDSDPSSTALLLQAGAHRMIGGIASHGR
jgi:hypothetical protein